MNDQAYGDQPFAAMVRDLPVSIGTGRSRFLLNPLTEVDGKVYYLHDLAHGGERGLAGCAIVRFRQQRWRWRLKDILYDPSPESGNTFHTFWDAEQDGDDVVDGLGRTLKAVNHIIKDRARISHMTYSVTALVPGTGAAASAMTLARLAMDGAHAT